MRKEICEPGWDIKISESQNLQISELNNVILAIKNPRTLESLNLYILRAYQAKNLWMNERIQETRSLKKYKLKELNIAQQIIINHSFNEIFIME